MGNAGYSTFSDAACYLNDSVREAAVNSCTFTAQNAGSTGFSYQLSATALSAALFIILIGLAIYSDDYVENTNYASLVTASAVLAAANLGLILFKWGL